jgi:hypothetical protein
MTTTAVLVFISANDCVHCTNFIKNELGKLEARVANIKKVEFVHIHLESRFLKVGAEYHPQLTSYIGWYPTFLLFTYSSWHSRNELYGVILNGIKMGNAIHQVNSSQFTEVTTDNIINWVNRNIEHNSIFSNNMNPIYVNQATSNNNNFVLKTVYN